MFLNNLKRVAKFKHVRYIHTSSKQTAKFYPVKLVQIEAFYKPLKYQSSVRFSSQDNIKFELTHNEFEHICEETLDSLCENLEILIESHPEIKGCDITYGDGVLTMSLGAHGTYVINRQTPNKQIWLSSPLSGPKRYDFFANTWIYKHDNVSLHSLLQKELTDIFKDNVDLSKCSYFVVKQK
uniref:ferroxidase n=2 Tax=Rhodnius TaxID=13248 RepID=A0A4V0Y8S2_RHOPR